MINEIKKYLADNMGIDDAETLCLLIEQFSEAVNSNLTALQQAPESDFAAMHQYAHTIKGCAGNVGLEELRQAAMRVDVAAKNSDLPGVRENMPDLQRLVMKFNQEFSTR
ncbi:MAG: Hpt domain-containing protein [Victivallaceae bacterium]